MQHLAELNIARIRYPLDDPRMADFVDNLDRINTLAERMPGFVWRLKDDGGDATTFRSFDDPDIIPNLSVWASVAAFETFAWRTVHRKFYTRRNEWFSKLDGPHFVMWWIEAGHVPDLEEAKARLEHLRVHGPTDQAFGWESLAGASDWMEARCA
ncbi:MAG: DUF3291 domain-containing protein [Pseudomonadota bacterium]